MANSYSVKKIKSEISVVNTEIRAVEQKAKLTMPGTLDYNIIECTLQGLYEKKARLNYILDLVNKLNELREKREKASNTYYAFINKYRGTDNQVICNKASNLENDVILIDNDIAALEAELASICCTYEYDIIR